ncbi:alcohol dehydrogenase [Cordyceps javanica]|uniref:Alcohol dehydrogenase n=1 Tax=Cordyceps javanica TaxID=43265 RepID=A0A545W351_9HYPO|nr:alcohol dehydrogenase [Cordyceps javanica]TQW08356.1 alcohol dehydrogenase [Cordyceps javanica]
MIETPAEMRAVVYPEYTLPPGYEHADVPRPAIVKPTDVIIKVHAASINPADVKRASGSFSALAMDEFPAILGLDVAGVVVNIGSDVTAFKVGAWAEYASSDEWRVALKPRNMSYVEAAAMPLAGMTALQALRRAKTTLEGKTVFIPGALSGTGSYAIQLAKRYFNAGKVITTASTSKIARISELLGEDVADQGMCAAADSGAFGQTNKGITVVIDYTKEDPVTVIPKGSVDFILDTMGQAKDLLPLLRPGASRIISICGTPSGQQVNHALVDGGGSPLPWGTRLMLDAIHAAASWRATYWRTSYSYMLLDPNAQDLAILTKCAEEGSLRSVVGRQVSFDDIDAVREACGVVYHGKGGLGKTVLVMAAE